MSTAGKWVLGLLLLVVGAVAVARAFSNDTNSRAQEKDVTLPAAANAADSKSKTAAPVVSADVDCKKPCVSTAEIDQEAVTTAKLASGSVTLSKLAFEVPNLSELQAEIDARKAAEANAKQAVADANAAANSANSQLAAASQKTAADITAAAKTGIDTEAAARAAGDQSVTDAFKAADAGLQTSLNQEIVDRKKDIDTANVALTKEIADRANADAGVRSDLLRVGGPAFVNVDNNEIVGNAVTSDKIQNETILSEDILNETILSEDIKNGEVKTSDLANASNDPAKPTGVTTDKLENSAVTTDKIKDGQVTTDDIAGQNVTNAKLADVDASGLNGAVSTDKIDNDAIKTEKIADHQVTFAKLDVPTQTRITDLEGGLAQEILDRAAADSTLTSNLNAEFAARQAADSTLTANLSAELAARQAADSTLTTNLSTEMSARQAADSTLTTNLSTEMSARQAADSAQDTAFSAFQSALLATNNSDPALVDWARIQNVPNDIKAKKASDLVCSECVDTTDIKDGAVSDAKVAAGLDGAKVTLGTITGQGGDTSGSPVGSLALGTVGADNLATGAVTFDKIEKGAVQGEAGSGGDPTNGNIALKSITNANIQEATIRGGKDDDPGKVENEIKDGTVSADDLGDGSVGSAELQDNSVTTLKLADGAVTTAKQTANAALGSKALINLTVTSGSPSTVVPDGSTTVAITPVGTEGTKQHVVQLTGQFQATGATVASGEMVKVTWQLFDGSTAVSPEYFGYLSSTSPTLAGSISQLLGPVTAGPVEGAAETYTLKVTVSSPTAIAADRTIAFTDANLAAVDLGRK